MISDAPDPVENEFPDDGGRVVLRRLGPGDEAEFLALARANVELHLPWVILPQTPEDVREFLSRFATAVNEGLLICDRETGAAAGNVNVNGIVRGRFQSASLGYVAFAPFAGKGYLAEGLRLVVRYCFENLRLHRLEINMQPGNAVSRHLAESLGGRYEGLSPAMLYIDGEWRDHERWTLFNPAYLPHASLPAR
ncbi:GNAT family N-acetyltransferase [Actinocorallia lasiicapitis]